MVITIAYFTRIMWSNGKHSPKFKVKGLELFLRKVQDRDGHTKQLSDMIIIFTFLGIFTVPGSAFSTTLHLAWPLPALFARPVFHLSLLLVLLFLQNFKSTSYYV